MNNTIILASRSPRRSELLGLAGIPFECLPSDIEEVLDESLPIANRMIDLAYQKALPIAKQYPERIVLGADTVVYIDDQTIGKAHSKEEAKEILLSLQGRTHRVLTGVCLLYKDKKETCYVSTDVVFRSLDLDEIEAYLELGEWEGKAGAYAIQGYGSRFVKEIHGDYSNIVGLPIVPVIEMLKSIKK